MNRYFIFLSYNGKNYCGWQIQPNGMSVQEKLEQSLYTLLRVQIAVTGAGRTDAGVHAREMVAHFDYTEDTLDRYILTEKLNRLLPSDISVKKIIKVPSDSHARFDAISRTYKYFLTEKKEPFFNEMVYKIPHTIDFEQMNKAAEILFDYTDFTSFSKLHTDVKTNNCLVKKAYWKKENDFWIFTIEADRFLRNMVRAIVGTLLEVGRGKCSLVDFRQIIESKDRGQAGTSVPAHALFLWKIEYTEKIMNYEFLNT